MEKASSLEEYRGFSFGNNNAVDILHFADDTIILGNGDEQNLWCLKAILRGFELMAGLKINFSKINIVGINLCEDYIQMSSTFMSCGIGVTPFKFLGVMVGDSPRKTAMWKEVINDIRRRLNNWRGKFLSVGGRVVLINSVLNAIPLYSLSFYRAPKKVIKEIVSIQRNFLWKGVEGDRGICWVSWRNVCRPKEEGGLGIRDVNNMNISLLMKWKWRICNEENAVWSNLLIHRYKNPVVKMFVNDKGVISSRDSIWWRDLILINDCDGSNGLSQLGGDQTLSEAYLELYDKAANRFASVAEAGHWEDDVWTWDNEGWLRESDFGDEDLLTSMQSVLLLLNFQNAGRDEILWRADEQ
ncbi:uncharacterized protein LOC131596153 [Vicia villosa]|uniref:uncharacterized protein LOC131596153 n=1 Tax=Vicia villosa TaxID=3911 RepID=UPI00273CD203|nr:uncharacterized protein LOC131596153 [Vicia villosa]